MEKKIDLGRQGGGFDQFLLADVAVGVQRMTLERIFNACGDGYHNSQLSGQL